MCERGGTDAHKLPISHALSVTASSTTLTEVRFFVPEIATENSQCGATEI